MTTQDRLAGEIHAALGGVGYSFDPTVIITIITTIMALFQGCNLTPAQAEKRANNPRLLDRLVLKIRIRQHVKDDDEADAMQAAFLDAGSELTVADFKKLYAKT